MRSVSNTDRVTGGMIGGASVSGALATRSEIAGRSLQIAAAVSEAAPPTSASQPTVSRLSTGIRKRRRAKAGMKADTVCARMERQETTRPKSFAQQG